jgi:type II secretory pathway pseudopilin PulG
MNLFTQKKKYSTHVTFVTNTAGFTLIEILVSLGIFIVAMTLISGAVLSVLDLNRKAQSEKTAIDNLSFALESMGRTIRFGTNFHCSASTPLDSPQNCSNGSPTFSITTPDGLHTYTYTFVPPSGSTSGSLTRALDGGAPISIVSPEVNITSGTFRVFGALPYPTLPRTCASPGVVADCVQPRIIINIVGTVGDVNKAKTLSTFKIETSVSQRKLDIQ